jgi:hypothetical protein
MYLRRLIALLGTLSPDSVLHRMLRQPQKILNLKVLEGHQKVPVMIVRKHLSRRLVKNSYHQGKFLIALQGPQISLKLVIALKFHFQSLHNSIQPLCPLIWLIYLSQIHSMCSYVHRYLFTELLFKEHHQERHTWWQLLENLVVVSLHGKQLGELHLRDFSIKNQCIMD